MQLTLREKMDIARADVKLDSGFHARRTLGYSVKFSLTPFNIVCNSLSAGTCVNHLLMVKLALHLLYLRVQIPA